MDEQVEKRKEKQKTEQERSTKHEMFVQMKQNCCPAPPSPLSLAPYLLVSFGPSWSSDWNAPAAVGILSEYTVGKQWQCFSFGQ